MKMRGIIADDEPLARRDMENLVREVSDLELVATCADGLEVLDFPEGKAG